MKDLRIKVVLEVGVGKSRENRSLLWDFSSWHPVHEEIIGLADLRMKQSLRDLYERVTMQRGLQALFDQIPDTEEEHD